MSRAELSWLASCNSSRNWLERWSIYRWSPLSFAILAVVLYLGGVTFRWEFKPPRPSHVENHSSRRKRSKLQTLPLNIPWWIFTLGTKPCITKIEEFNQQKSRLRLRIQPSRRERNSSWIKSRILTNEIRKLNTWLG